MSKVSVGSFEFKRRGGDTTGKSPDSPTGPGNKHQWKRGGGCDKFRLSRRPRGPRDSVMGCSESQIVKVGQRAEVVWLCEMVESNEKNVGEIGEIKSGRIEICRSDSRRS
jgi:hypothetical protein